MEKIHEIKKLTPRIYEKAMKTTTLTFSIFLPAKREDISVVSKAANGSVIVNSDCRRRCFI